MLNPRYPPISTPSTYHLPTYLPTCLPTYTPCHPHTRPTHTHNIIHIHTLSLPHPRARLYWDKVPPIWKPHWHFYNTPIHASAAHGDSPLRMVRKTIKKILPVPLQFLHTRYCCTSGPYSPLPP